ncbi:MAG TPA: nucleotidyltransferase domain-containing protein [Rhodospirillales bacterium]|nr:nucleotidyltransferase domain-containing protein [Rhodospirillales bacterium]
MRLSEEHRAIIREEVAREFGPEAEVLLFGSRVDDTARGGDVDLLVRVPHAVEDSTMAAVRLATRLERRFDGRRVDVLLLTPDTPRQPIHDIAERTGVRL